MRTVALGLFALAGCNQLLGLDSVVVTDGGIDALPYDAPLPIVSLRAITPTLDLDERATGEVSKVDLSGAGPVKVQYGLIGENLQSLVTGVYPSTGAVEIPQPLLDQRLPWRFVYAVGNSPAKEVHFTGTETIRSVADVQMTPFSRPAVTPSTSLVFNPSDAPATFPIVRVWSTNAWSETTLPSQPGPTLTVDLEALTPIEGVKRAPGKNDDVIIGGVSDLTTGDCHVVTQTGAFRYEVMDAAVTDPSPPSWLLPTTHEETAVTIADPGAPALDLALASKRGAGGIVTTSSLTQTPTGKLSLFRTTTGTPVVTGATMASCSKLEDLTGFKLPKFATTSPPFKLVGAYSYSQSLMLASGPQVVDAIISANALGDTATQFQLAYSVAVPFEPIIGTTSVSTQLTSVVEVPLSGVTSQLAWTSANDGQADAYQITLYQVTGAVPQPIREYTIASGPLTFDTQLLQPNTSYAFRIRALRGMPDAKMGAFDTWNEAQELAQTWTQAFKRL